MVRKDDSLLASDPVVASDVAWAKIGEMLAHHLRTLHSAHKRKQNDGR